MGIFHNSKTNDDKVTEEIIQFLAEGEEVQYSLQQIRDQIILTNLRLIIIDKQGVTGRKKKVTNYLLNRIVKVEFENSPYLDIDSEIEIQFGGISEPVKFEIAKRTNIFEFTKVLFEQLGHH
jgi:Bacterial PH domain